MMDPPEHDRLRELVEPGVHAAGGHGAGADGPQGHHRLLDPLIGRDRIDFVEQFSAPFPFEVISRMLGVPKGERQQIRHASTHAAPRARRARTPPTEGMQARHARECRATYGRHSRRSGGRPADDMITHLTQADGRRRRGGRDPLDDEEVAGFAGLLAWAGAETVTKLVGSGVVLFGRHPDQWRRGRSTTPPPSPAPSRRSCGTAAVAVPGPLLGRGLRVGGRHDPRRLAGVPAHRGGQP